MAKPRSSAPQVNRKPAAAKAAEAQTTPASARAKASIVISAMSFASCVPKTI